MPITDARDPASPARPDRWGRLRGRVSRYVRARAADLFGDPGPLRAARDGIARASAAIDLAIGRGEEGGRGQPAATALRRRHETEARAARTFFSAAVVAALACAHRLWLADLAGAGASLGMAFTLAGLALRPAYRCHRLRARLADPDPAAAPDPRAFLRRPSAWWPDPLPPDDPA